MLATSEPAEGSVMARQINFSPLKQGPTTLSCIAGEANFKTGGSPIAVPAVIPHYRPELPNLFISSYSTSSWKVSWTPKSTPQTTNFAPIYLDGHGAPMHRASIP